MKHVNIWFLLHEIHSKSIKSMKLFKSSKVLSFLFSDLYDWEEVREEAIANFNAHASEMMYVTAYGLRKDLHLSEEKSE